MKAGLGSWSVAGLVLALGSVATADGPVPPPAPVLDAADARHALLLEPADLRSSTSLAAEPRSSVPPGTVLSWLGETTDDFGRTWQIVGDPEAWQLRETWYVTPFEPASIPPGETSGWIAGFRAPPDEAAAGEAEGTIAIAEDWWSRVVAVGPGHPFEAGGLVAVPAVSGSDEQVRELLDLVGLEALGPWPDEPSWGQLHVPAALPLVFVRGREGWRPLDPPRFVGAGPDLLGNPGLLQDPEAPMEAAGRPLQCWTLVGALDPAGSAVGRLEVAAAAPAAIPPRDLPALPGARFFGHRDLAGRVLPPAPPATARPVRAVPSSPDAGVRLEDTSRRQAVFLEQALPAPVVRWLRGRTVVLRVGARRVPGSEGSATAGVELVVGSTREARSRTLGPRTSELTIEATVPEDAEQLVVRLLPQDRSVAVQEVGNVVFDRASLVPTGWRTAPSPLRLRRVLLSSYRPARRYTQAELTVSRRPAEELAGAWRTVQSGDLPEPARRRILEGRLAAGMSREAVELAWGGPQGRERLLGGATRWDWSDRSATFSPAGELVAWTSRRQVPEVVGSRCLADLFEEPEGS